MTNINENIFFFEKLNFALRYLCVIIVFFVSVVRFCLWQAETPSRIDGAYSYHVSTGDNEPTSSVCKCYVLPFSGQFLFI